MRIPGSESDRRSARKSHTVTSSEGPNPASQRARSGSAMRTGTRSALADHDYVASTLNAPEAVTLTGGTIAVRGAWDNAAGLFGVARP